MSKKEKKPEPIVAGIFDDDEDDHVGDGREAEGTNAGNGRSKRMMIDDDEMESTESRKSTESASPNQPNELVCDSHEKSEENVNVEQAPPVPTEKGMFYLTFYYYFI